MLDCFILGDGRTYSIPLITTNPDLGSDYNPARYPKWFEKCRDLYYNWWKNEHHKFTLEDFFTYGKPNDLKMLKRLNYKEKMKYE